MLQLNSKHNTTKNSSKSETVEIEIRYLNGKQDLK